MSLIRTNFMDWPNLSSFFENEWFKDKFNGKEWMPAVNVIENDGNFELEVAAPGFKKGDFNISVDNGVMTINAESKTEKEEKEKNYTRKEFSSNSFMKSFTLPENVEEDSIDAKYTDGVLKIFITKNEKVLPPKKQIQIN